MQSALWVSKTGLTAQDTKMTAIANNLANVNTTGFKRDRVAFNDLFYQVQRQPGGQVDALNNLPSGLQLGAGTRVVGTQKNIHDRGYAKYQSATGFGDSRPWFFSS